MNVIDRTKIVKNQVSKQWPTPRVCIIEKTFVKFFDLPLPLGVKIAPLFGWKYGNTYKLKIYLTIIILTFMIQSTPN